MQFTDVLTVVGARPQIIKAGPVSHALREAGLKEVLVHTGQHYDHSMSDVFFEELGIKMPDVNLGIGSGSHADQTARMMAALEQPMTAHKPKWVLVFGDTNSTLAAAITAAKLRYPIAHVEAGLRSFNRFMPEEINRVVTDTVSAVLFAPSMTAKQNLLNEGIEENRIRVTGDVMLDAVFHYRNLVNSPNGHIANLPLRARHYALVTIHRAENTDHPLRLRCLLDSLNALATSRDVVFLVHPRTRKLMNGWTPATRVRVLDPQSYLQMSELIRSAGVVVTDSGGLQKEAFFHGVACVTVRAETEWTELLALGWNRLAPPVSVHSVVEAIENAWGQSGIPASPYGDGTASNQIVRTLADLSLRREAK